MSSAWLHDAVSRYAWFHTASACRSNSSPKAVRSPAAARVNKGSSASLTAMAGPRVGFAMVT